MATSKAKPVKKKAVKKPTAAALKKQKYDRDFESICKEIENGIAVRKVCPAYMSLEKFYQLIAESPEKTKRYACACEARAETIFEDIIEIADTSNADVFIINGKMVVDGEAIQRSKLKIDARKWMLARLAPKKYGDKIEVDANLTGQVTNIISLGSGINPDDTTT
ncbi:terminase small subunit-like protein [Pedobacter duraquae]|nr:hypothetical protein [Pedobacter duraquae]